MAVLSLAWVLWQAKHRASEMAGQGSDAASQTAEKAKHQAQSASHTHTVRQPAGHQPLTHSLTHSLSHSLSQSVSRSVTSTAAPSAPEHLGLFRALAADLSLASLCGGRVCLLCRARTRAARRRTAEQSHRADRLGHWSCSS